ncbi:hypothetical protein B9N43_16715 [Denitratisoma sp. DHT3]|nr:hypothetical protein B9N43_16715 [Denitratisoma sp. DHT3]
MNFPRVFLRPSLRRAAFLSALLASLMGAAVLLYAIGELDRLQSLLSIALISGLLLSMATLFYSHFRIRKPLARISRMCDRIADGDLSVRLRLDRQDEFRCLGERFNRMVDALQALREEQALAERAVRDSELRHRTLWEVSADAMVMVDAHGVIGYANPAVADVFGFEPHELQGRSLTVLLPDHVHEPLLLGFSHYIKSGGQHRSRNGIELSAVHQSGRRIPVEVFFAHMKLSGGDLFVGSFRDISQRVEAQANLQIQDRAIESAADGIMITDVRVAEHPIIYANPALERITGYCSAELLGRGGRIFLGEDVDQIEVNELRRMFLEHREGATQLRGRRKDGESYWIDLSVAPVRNAKSEITHYISIMRDVTERKQQENALLRSANYDLLTGLPNRSLFYDRLSQILARGERHQRDAAVMFIDLDHFKLVNDSLGHDHGDQLLAAVAAKLKICLREGDTVARWGGDEFVILLADLGSRDDIAIVAGRVQEGLGESITLGEQEVYCTASIGVSVFPDDGNTTEALLKHADLAMYRAKSQGRNTWSLYADDMQQGVDRRFSLETQLRKAIEKDELFLNFQPQIELSSGRVIGVEALVRWQHPELGLVSPSFFIPVAEESGMMAAIGEWVLHAACAEAKRWQTLGLMNIRVAVNISPCQFAQNDLAERIVSVLDHHGLQAGDIELEITESIVMCNPSKTVDTLRHLKALGIHVALDDFGTGHSSLAYFKNFPLNRLKIDKSFIQDETIVRAVIQMSISYGIQIVAEGVEDEATAQMLYRLGCDVVQGFHYSYPLSADELVEFLQRPPKTVAAPL